VQHPRATPEGATRPQKTRFRHKEGKPTMQHPRVTPEGATCPKKTWFRSMEGIPPCNTPEPLRTSTYRRKPGSTTRRVNPPCSIPEPPPEGANSESPTSSRESYLSFAQGFSEYKNQSNTASFHSRLARFVAPK